jgi:hypothetical protein
LKNLGEYGSSLNKLWVFSLLGILCSAWARPGSPTQIKQSDEYNRRLDYVMVEVNGEPRIIRAGGELAVVRGDKVEVKQAQLVDKDIKIEVVNVVGYANAKRGGSEDRNMVINTGTQLAKRFSENGGDQVYAVTAVSRGEFHGAVYIRMVEPTLRYAVISVNGDNRVLRDGEKMTINRNDMVKVARVESNVADDKEIEFQIFEHAEKGRSDFEIRFTRGEQIFARIPLVVTE